MIHSITRALLSSALQCQVVDGAADAERAEQAVEARTCSMTDDDAGGQLLEEEDLVIMRSCGGCVCK